MAKLISTILSWCNRCHEFHRLGTPILVGHSRKGFIAHAMQDRDADRTAGTVAVTLGLARRWVQIIRVHDVAANVHALRVWKAIGELEEARSAVVSSVK